MADASVEGPAVLDEAAIRRLVDLCPDAMLAHRRGVVVWCNEAAAALLAVPGGAAGAPGRRALDFVAPESAPAVLARMQRMLATGASEPLLLERLVRVDGGRVDVETSAAPVGDGVVLVVMRDVTAREQAERERRLAEARARAFFDVTAAPMAIARDGVHLQLNAAYAALFGYAGPEEMVGTRALDHVAPEERERVLAIMRGRAEGDHRQTEYEVVGLRRDGTRFLGAVRAAAFAEGASTCSVVVMRDVTAERDYARRLADSERHHRELMAHVPVGVWLEDGSGAKAVVDRLRAAGVADLETHLRTHPEDLAACARGMRVVEVNAAACTLVGARDQAELVANLDRILIPESLADFASELSQLAEGRPVAVIEGWNGTLDGGRRWVAVRVAVAPGHERDWGRLVVTTADVTDRRRAAEEKGALQERLRHAEKLEAVGRLAGGVAHDFNNVLAAVMGFAEASLQEATPGTPLHEAQLHIRDAARRARELVRQILAFSRGDRPEQRPVDVAVVVTEALALARAAIPAGVEVAARIDPAAGAALADSTQLHQIVLNLCANARDAVGPGGHIEVSLEAVDLPGTPDLPGGPYLRLRVRDDGVGMDEATRARIFEPYLTTKARTGGHGLGLAVVHGIVAGCGGAIRVETAPGRGACFDVLLPRLAPAAAVPPPAAVPPAQRGSGRILLVDDEPLVRKAHRRLLQGLGYQVAEAADGAEALARLRAEPEAFDLVLTDQTMPRLSGAELASALLAERPDMRVVLCTGYTDAVDDARAAAIGVRGMVAKPVDRDVLAAVVRQALA